MFTFISSLSRRCWRGHSARKQVINTLVRQYMSPNSNILKLRDRGLFQNVFPEDHVPELHRALVGSPQCVYCGFDPTADSLHIGNLLAIIGLLHCQRAGHQAIAVIGGATAQIGDPSGRSTERSQLQSDVVRHNVQSIRRSLQQIFDNYILHFDDGKRDLLPVIILDNADWYAKRNVVEFLCSVGRHFRVGQMLSRESVQSRMKSVEGLSLAEFMYQAFQAYDWLHLYKHHNCRIQIGGSDQMGNIYTGHELISRVVDKPVFGLTIPLITNTAGNKLGKTAGNAVWLNDDKTTPFDLYQFYIRVADNEVERLLKLFTFQSDNEISDMIMKHMRNPDGRSAQRKLAEDVTLLVHGEAGLQSALRCTAALYEDGPQRLAELSSVELGTLFKNASTCELWLEPGTTIRDVVMKARCFSTSADAERVISAGGVYMNQQRVTEPQYVVIPGQHILPNNITLVRVGKKNYYIIKWKGLT